MEESGNLVITKLAASDQGRYVCVAQNIIGNRETSPVLLTVNGKKSLPPPLLSYGTRSVYIIPFGDYVYLGPSLSDER